MLFGRKDKKKPNDRVLDLKARVDALRQAEESFRAEEKAEPYSLDRFLSGDDVLTGREVEESTQTGAGPSPAQSGGGTARPEGRTSEFEGSNVDLEAELQKYLQRQEALGRGESPATQPPVSPAPADRSWDTVRGDAPGDFKPSKEPADEQRERPIWLTPFSDEVTPKAEHSPWPSLPDAGWSGGDPWQAEDESAQGDGKAV